MAKRMFSDEVTQTDSFLDLPSTTQLLYFHLGMNADDDGFISSPKMVMRVIKAGDDDLKLLFAKKFLLPFENGVCVVKHWRINNNIRKDIYKATKYLENKKQLFIRSNGAYTFNPENAVPVPEGHFTIPESTQKMLTSTTRQRNVDLGKDSKGKDSKDKKKAVQKRFTKPTVEEIKAYCDERKNKVSPQKFFNYYESKGWLVGKSPMKDWKAAVRTWEQNGFDDKKNPVKAEAGKYDKFS